MPGRPSKLVVLVSVVALAALGPAAGTAPSGRSARGDIAHLPSRLRTVRAQQARRGANRLSDPAEALPDTSIPSETPTTGSQARLMPA